MLIPWVIDIEDFSVELDTNKYDSDICLGHFEIKGFVLNKFSVSNEGISSINLLNHFKTVYSGHFHKRSRMEKLGKSINYIGSPYQITRSDLDEERGFVIMDAETGETEFIENKESAKFVSLKYPRRF